MRMLFSLAVLPTPRSAFFQRIQNFSLLLFLSLSSRFLFLFVLIVLESISLVWQNTPLSNRTGRPLSGTVTETRHFATSVPAVRLFRLGGLLIAHACRTIAGAGARVFTRIASWRIPELMIFFRTLLVAFDGHLLLPPGDDLTHRSVERGHSWFSFFKPALYASV